MSLVLDASVALAWCFEDEQTPEVMDLLDRVAETGGVAPLLWPLEALNGLFAAERRRRIAADKRATLAAFLRALPITLDGDTAERVWTRRHGWPPSSNSPSATRPTWNSPRGDACRSHLSTRTSGKRQASPGWTSSESQARDAA